MISFKQAEEKLHNGEMDAVLCHTYGCGKQETAYYRDRLLHVIDGFRKNFPEKEIELFSAPGRTELGGNHTDHQCGNVLAGSVNLDIAACAAPNGTNIIRIISEGYPQDEIDISDLTPQPDEVNHTASLIRGVAAAAHKQGYTVGGFDCYMTSNVLGGSGLSSSAAYEVAVGTIINRFFCDEQLTDVDIAKIGQYAENIYFGKPCGLLDQMAASVGGIIAVDFTSTEQPVVTRVDRTVQEYNHALCIIDTGGDHKELTAAYAAIPEEMGAVAEFFGKTVLREVEEKLFMQSIPALRERCGDRPVLRAMHFFAETKRAVEEKTALENGDFDYFLSLVNASGRSSAMYLQNVYAGITPLQQEVVLSLALAEHLLKGRGAVRVHGGGFAGTIQAFVPMDMVEEFRSGMEAVLGKDRCHVLTIRPVGGTVLMK